MNSFKKFTTAAYFGSSLIASAWQPGVIPAAGVEMVSKGFSVDTKDRNDVVAFWQAVYQASEGYSARIAWTGNYKGTNGDVSPVFVRDVERRLNFFRAICGVPADVSVNSGTKVVIGATDAYKPLASTTKSSASQAAALMLVRNYNSSTGANPAITHNPASSLVGWSSAAWNAAAHGNFAFGLYGPGAITEYMAEEFSSTTVGSTWNSQVGHRRWCLFPRATDYATGDQPGASAYVPPTNVLYVIQNTAEVRANDTSGFVSFPAAGFFPASINSRFWSISRRGADFTFATVSMTDSTGKVLTVSNIKRDTSYGDPAIVWQVPDPVLARSVFKDTTYNVSLAGISGTGVPTSYSYSVTLINPNSLTSDQTLSGSSTLAAAGSATYTFTPPSRAEAINVVAAQRSSSIWKSDGESSALPALIDGTGTNYDLVATTSSFQGFGTVSGTKAFHLTFPTIYDAQARGVPQQYFEIDRDILPNASATLSFKFRRGFMTTGSSLVVEMTADGGVTWVQLGAAINGVSNSAMDTAVSTTTRSLPLSTEPIRVRFRYFTNGGAVFTHDATPTYATGIFIDDITTTNSDWLEEKKVNSVATTATSFLMNATSSGATFASGQKWHLRLRTKLGGKWFPAGPSKIVSITAS